jgi:hypothetical protein
MVLLHKSLRRQPLGGFPDLVFVVQFEDQAGLVGQSGERFKEGKPIDATNAEHPVAIKIAISVLQVISSKMITPWPIQTSWRTTQQAAPTKEGAVIFAKGILGATIGEMESGDA